MLQKNKWLWSLIMALSTAILMQWQGSSLKTVATPLGIVSLELASKTEGFEQIMSIWNYSTVRLNIWLDFLFIPAYTFFFINSLSILANQYDKVFMRNLGKKLIAFAFVAAGLDVMENILMLFALGGHYSKFSLQSTALVASSKFAIIAMILIYLIGSTLIILFSTKNKSKKSAGRL